MKILIIGFFVFFTWSTLSTYLYVCKIKGLCFEQVTAQNDVVLQKIGIEGDIATRSVEPAIALMPKDLTIYFAFDKYDLIPDSVLGNYFIKSNDYLMQNAKSRLLISGHADAIGTDDYNYTLGYKRAQSIMYYFERKGILAAMIVFVSKGGERTYR